MRDGGRRRSHNSAGEQRSWGAGGNHPNTPHQGGSRPLTTLEINSDAGTQRNPPRTTPRRARAEAQRNATSTAEGSPRRDAKGERQRQYQLTPWLPTTDRSLPEGKQSAISYQQSGEAGYAARSSLPQSLPAPRRLPPTPRLRWTNRQAGAIRNPQLKGRSISRQIGLFCFLFERVSHLDVYVLPLALTFLVRALFGLSLGSA